MDSCSPDGYDDHDDGDNYDDHDDGDNYDDGDDSDGDVDDSCSFTRNSTFLLAGFSSTS